MTPRMNENGLWHDGMQCFVTGLSYDFKQHHGRLDMAKDNCCDMDGCLTLFEAIDPGCRFIQTFADGKRDTYYARWSQGWKAITVGV